MTVEGLLAVSHAANNRRSGYSILKNLWLYEHCEKLMYLALYCSLCEGQSEVLLSWGILEC